MRTIFIFILFIIPFAGDCQYISTVAGGGTSPGTDGVGDGGYATDASFSQPSEVKVDAYGNLFIDDVYNYRIRKIDLLGIIISYVGTGFPGFTRDGGLADTTKIGSGGSEYIFDTRGNFIYSDINNQIVRKVDKVSRIVTTIAGTGTIGFSGDSSIATNAEFTYPGHITNDAKGNIYIADVGNKRVRKIDTFGIITTYAGNGIAGYSGDGHQADSAELSNAMKGLACDTFCNLYISDGGNLVIRKVDAITHIISTIAGNGTGTFIGSGISALSEGINPGGLAVDAYQNLYISDFGSMRILKDTAGMIYSVAGNGVTGFTGDGGLADTAELHSPYDVTIDACGNLYIADVNNERIRKVTFNPGCVDSILSAPEALPLRNITLYPNPAHYEVHIDGLSEDATYTLMNMMGQVVARGALMKGSNSIGIREINNGIYMLHVTNERESGVYRVLKE